MATLLSLVLGALLVVLVPLLWKVVVINLIWRPYALGRVFRKQGLSGPPYKFLLGSIKEIKSINDASKDLILDKNTHDITPRVFPHYRQWIDQYGSTFVFWSGARPMMVFTDLEMIKEVLLNKYGLYPKIIPPSNILALLGKGGLVFSDGSKWAKHRRIVNPAFATDKLKMLTKEMAECTRQMLESWRNQITQADNQEKEIEVGKQFAELTGDVISHTAFGSSYMLGKEVFLAIRELQTIAAEALLSIDIIPGFEYLPTKRHLHKWKIERNLRKKLMGVISSRLDSKDHTHGNDLLGLLLEANQKEDDQKLSMDDLIDECKTFYFAGHETTSHLLTWTLFLLSINQDWQEKLREEVLGECGMEVPNADSLGKLKLVTMVLFETLRLYGPVNVLVRRVGTDVKLGNIQIPKDTGLMMPIGIIHRDPELWGSDANEFNPLRFENGVSSATKHPIAMLAFSVGPRACLGQNFALMEAKTAVAMILQRFSFSLSHNYKHAPMEFLTLQPKFGLPIVFRSLNA